MAIRDIIVPGFIGDNNIKWIPTRGFLSFTGVSPGDKFIAPIEDRTFVEPKCSRTFVAPIEDRTFTGKQKR